MQVKEITIDCNVPLPGRVGGESKYPFTLMNVGDSFFVEGAKSATLLNAARAYAKRNQGTVKFAVRTVDGGARCWRVA